MKLYGIGKSRWNRPYWLLNELDVPFEKVVVDPRRGEHRSPDFLRLNPYGKLPVLVDGDLVLFESVAICQYLVDKFPEGGLMPTGLEERAQAHQWIAFCVAELEGPLWRRARHTFVYPREKRLPAEIELATRDYLQAARVLEAHMQDREFLVGEGFSVVDILVGYIVVWAGWDDLLHHTPNLQAYRDRLMLRPALPETMRTPPQES